LVFLAHPPFHMKTNLISHNTKAHTSQYAQTRSTDCRQHRAILRSYRLSQLGWNVMPTARNAKGVDLIAYSLDGPSYVGLQIKSLSKRSLVPLGTSLGGIMGDYWVIAYNVVDSPVAFVMKPDEVKRLAHRGERSNKVSYWLQPNAYDVDKIREAWDRIKAR